MKSVIETQAELIKNLQDRNDLFAKTITRFSQEMVALKEAHDHVKFEYQRMVKFYDTQVGTPCEEIRHAQEVEVYKEHIGELTATIQSQAGVIEKLNFDIQKRGGFVEIDDRKAKSVLYDLDAVGIEYRMREAAELVDARAKIGEFRKKIEIMAKMIGDQGQEISTLKALKDSAKWRMEQLATYTLEQGKLVLSLQAKLGDTERDHQQAIYALGQSEDAYLKLETKLNEVNNPFLLEVISLRAKLDGEPCNLDFQREAAKMSAYADKCLTIKEEAMGHAAAMSNDLTAMGEHAELLTEQLVQAHEKLATANFLADTYKKLYGECYMESGKRNEKNPHTEGDDWP